jgi:nucleotide-binding universal stress UspA family protein
MNRMFEGQGILVAVDGGAHGWDALEWAAAEAAAAGQTLHVVHVAEWPTVIDAWTQLPGEHFAAVGVTADYVIAEAVRRAYAVAPDLRVTTQVVGDAKPGPAILRAARNASLIVLGRRRDGGALRSRFGSSVGSYLERHASAPVVIAGLADRAAGPSAGRIAVLVDGQTDAFDALALAFRAAQRRGIGVTVLHTSPTRGAAAEFDAVALISAFRDAFETVDVIEEDLPAPVGPALPATSEGAALLVVGARPSRHLHRAQITPVSRHIAEVSRTPVVFVPTVAAA